MLDHLLTRQLGPGHRTSARIADHGREIANDQHRSMSCILELTQFAQGQCVSEMQVRAGRIHPELDSQGPTESELFPQLRLAGDLRGALSDEIESLVGMHAARD